MNRWSLHWLYVTMKDRKHAYNTMQVGEILLLKRASELKCMVHLSQRKLFFPWSSKLSLAMTRWRRRSQAGDNASSWVKQIHRYRKSIMWWNSGKLYTLKIVCLMQNNGNHLVRRVQLSTCTLFKVWIIINDLPRWKGHMSRLAHCEHQNTRICLKMTKPIYFYNTYFSSCVCFVRFNKIDCFKCCAICSR